MYIWNLIKMIQKNLFIKQKETLRFKINFIVTIGKTPEGIGRVGILYTNYSIK